MKTIYMDIFWYGDNLLGFFLVWRQLAWIFSGMETTCLDIFWYAQTFSCLFSHLVSLLEYVVSEACHQGFSLGIPVSSPPSSINGSANKIKLK